ncbi:MAG: hypothetical protein ACE5H0_01610 [Bacteroidota bacterium]
MRLLIRIDLLAIAAVLYLSTVGASQDTMKYRNGSAREPLQLIEATESVFVLDMRTGEELKGELGHLQNARLITIEEFTSLSVQD